MSRGTAIAAAGLVACGLGTPCAVNGQELGIAIIDLVSAASNAGDTVWEPFVGLCTVAATCVHAGRRAFCAEPEPYFAETGTTAARRATGIGRGMADKVAASQSGANVYSEPTGRHDAMTTATPRQDPEVRPRATYQDVLEAPRHQVAEIVDGALYTNPRPAAPHALAASALEINLGTAFQFGRGGPGGWWIIVEPELHLSNDILVPDLAGWRRARMASFPETAYFTLTPDWVCEILSPSTRKLDLEAKRPAYAREGVRHLWLVDPGERTLEAFELTAGAWTRIATDDDELVRIAPFEAAGFNLADLWP